MIKKILFSAITLLAAVSLTGCLGTDSNNVNTQTFQYTQCFNSVTDLDASTTSAIEGATYKIAIDYVKQTADVVIDNLKLSPETTGLSFKLEKMPWTISPDGFYIISATTITPTGLAQQYVVENFKCEMLLRVINYSSMPVYAIQFTVNDRYHVCAVPAQNVYFGTTGVVKADGSGSTFYSTETTYNILLDPKTMKGDINIGGAKFGEGMPAQNFTIKNVPFTLNGHGYSFNGADQFIPEQNGTPNPQYPISNINGWANVSSGMNLQFNCVVAQMGEYNVTCNLKFMPDKSL